MLFEISTGTVHCSNFELSKTTKLSGIIQEMQKKMCFTLLLNGKNFIMVIKVIMLLLLHSLWFHATRPSPEGCPGAVKKHSKK